MMYNSLTYMIIHILDNSRYTVAIPFVLAEG